MCPATAGLPLGISTSKFYPPQIDPARHLFRESLVDSLLTAQPTPKLIRIEAQAGQGKSILAAQYLSRLDCHTAWYQIGPEDGDPVRMLADLLACFTDALPGFESPLLAVMIAKGEVNALEIPRFIDILLNDLAAHLDRECVLVFDDLHRLEELPHSQTLLAHLLQSSQSKLRFVLVSRRPVQLGEQLEELMQQACTIGNDQLALAETEVFSLYNDLLDIPLSHPEARELCEATEGWVMGTILASHNLEGAQQGSFVRDLTSSIQNLSCSSLSDYFCDEVFPTLPQNLRHTLCKLALLESIPLTLAERLADLPDIQTVLIELVRRNYFVRQLDSTGETYGFHHLFRDTLRTLTKQELTQDEITSVYSDAAGWYLVQQCPEKALQFYVLAKDYDAVERVLEQEGMDFLARNRTITLAGVLDPIPDAVILQYGWMTLVYSMICMNRNPPEAHSFLEKSVKIFRLKKEHHGELLALSQHLFFHLNIDGHFVKGAPLLERAEKIFPMVFDELTPFSQVQVPLILSTAKKFIISDTASAKKYSDIALKYARAYGFDNLLAAAYVARCWASFPDWDLFANEVEGCNTLIDSQHVDAINRLYLRLAQINLLGMTGDFENYSHLELKLLQEIENNLLAKTLSGPFLYIWKADIAIAKNDLKNAMLFVERGLELSHAGASGHIQSQFYHYLSFLKALSGEVEEAKAAAEKSIGLRDESGGRYFQIINKVILGGAFALLEIKESAEVLLAQAIEESTELNDNFLRAGAHAHRAYLKLQLGEKNAILYDVRECLRCLAINQYSHFFSWTPKVMQPLLETAIKHNIEPAYAQKLANERLNIAILPDGTSIPLLQIRTLGGFSIAVKDETILTAEQFTPAMRELLALLLAAPGCKLGQEQILATLWPEVPEAKARSRFDTLLSELRKLLKKPLPAHDIKHYLAMKRGMLCLQNIQTDAHQFETFANKGLGHVRNKEFWQAGNSFYSALKRWQGPFLPGLQNSDMISIRAEDLSRLYIEATLQWAEILVESGRFDEAGEILIKARQFERTHDDLVRCLYQVHVQSKQPAQANQLLKQYEAALRSEEYPPGEIEKILEAVWSSVAIA